MKDSNQVNLEYGFAREPSESQWYLMKRREDNLSWFNAVAAYKGISCREEGFKDPKMWDKNNFQLYSVLEEDIIGIDIKDAESLLGVVE